MSNANNDYTPGRNEAFVTTEAIRPSLTMEPRTSAGRMLRHNLVENRWIAWMPIDDGNEEWVAQAIARIETEAGALSSEGDGPDVLGKHRPHWVQSRDEDVGMWRCDCGITFAPDDLDRFHTHLIERLQGT